jgi:hypothetical protein
VIHIEVIARYIVKHANAVGSKTFQVLTDDALSVATKLERSQSRSDVDYAPS